MFDLKRPCVNCPFRRGQGENFRLEAERLAEIRAAPAFQCHKTVDYSGEGPRQGSRPQQCAGLISVLRAENEANQITQIAERIAGLDLGKFDPENEAYGSWAEVLNSHLNS